MTKPTKLHVRPAKTQISLGIRPVWSEPSLYTQWVAKDTSFLHADSEDSDQTGRMPRLIWVFAGFFYIIILSGLWITRTLIRLCICAGWFTPVLFAYAGHTRYDASQVIMLKYEYLLKRCFNWAHTISAKIIPWPCLKSAMNHIIKARHAFRAVYLIMY